MDNYCAVNQLVKLVGDTLLETINFESVKSGLGGLLSIVREM